MGQTGSEQEPVPAEPTAEVADLPTAPVTQATEHAAAEPAEVGHSDPADEIAEHPVDKAGNEPSQAAAAQPTEPAELTPTEVVERAVAETDRQAMAKAEAARIRGTDKSPRGAYTEAWAKLVADPGHAPELLALAAVQTVGPRAREWARRTREAYPGATDAGLARLATQQFTRFGSLSGVLGAVAGSYSSIALLGAAALTHAELILHLAAAYGLDPTDEERAVDLLVLTKVHPDAESARATIASARQPAYEEGGMTAAAWRLGRLFATHSGGWTAVRFVNRFYPGVSLLFATLGSRASATGVAHRALAYYGRDRADAGTR